MVQIEQNRRGVKTHIYFMLFSVSHKHDVHICTVIHIVVIVSENKSFVW